MQNEHNEQGENELTTQNTEEGSCTLNRQTAGSEALDNFEPLEITRKPSGAGRKHSLGSEGVILLDAPPPHTLPTFRWRSRGLSALSAVEDFDDIEKGAQSSGINSVWGVSINLINCMIGAGVLTMAKMLKEASLVPGLIILVFMGVLTCASCWLVGYLCEETQVKGSWARLWEYYFGDKWGWVTEVLSIVFVYGAIIVYAMLIKTYLKDLLTSLGTSKIESYVAIPIVFIILVGVCMIDEKYLMFSSALGIIAIALTMITIVADYGVDPPTENNKSVKMKNSVRICVWDTVGILNAFCACGFGFACHFSAPIMYSDLRDRTPKRFAYSTGFSFGFCIVLYAIVGAVGYFKHGAAIEKEYLSHLATADKITWQGLLARFSMFISIFSGYPLYVSPLRKALNSFMTRVGYYHEEPTEFNKQQRIVTVIIILCAVLPAWGDYDISVVINLATAIVGSWVILGVPGIMGMAHTKDDGCTKFRVLSITLTTMSILLFVMGIIGWAFDVTGGQA